MNELNICIADIESIVFMNFFGIMGCDKTLKQSFLLENWSNLHYNDISAGQDRTKGVGDGNEFKRFLTEILYAVAF